jgi:ABC-2 type transport system ATP-binding protein
VQIINKGELVLSDTIAGLQMRMQASSLLAGLRHMPDVEELQAIPGVQAVEPLGDNRVRLHYTPDRNPAEVLVARSVEHNWGLFELIPERLSLEQIFVDITCEEHHAPVTEAAV